MSIYDVIMVSYGNKQMIRNCIDSVDRNSCSKARMIWIDNKPEDSPASSMPEPTNIGMIYLPMFENIGWVKGVNVGLGMSTAPFVVLMNSDTEVWTEQWLDQLRSAYRPGVACVVPRHEHPWNVGLLTPDRGPVEVTQRWTLDENGYWDSGVGFHCVMISRNVIEEVGYLDERFSPGYADDDDWLLRAYLAGLKVVCNTDVLVKHIGSASYGESKSLIQPVNRMKFLRKHESVLTSRVI